MRVPFLSICVLSALLTACGIEKDDLSIEILSVENKHQVTPVTPSLLRSIPVDSLSLTLTINEIETTYQGAGSADGRWPIEVELMPNQQYDLLVRWHTSDHLLLEEFGTFTTPESSASIAPELDYRSAGTAEFDSDCDGFSNLEEVLNGTSLTIAEGLTSTACTDNAMPLELQATERAWMFRLHDLNTNNSTAARVTRFDQSMQINTANPASNIAFIANLVANPVNAATGESTRNAGWLSFRQRPDGARFMEFAIYPATSTVESGMDNQFCQSLMSEPEGLMCTVPYPWQEDRWYTITIEETTATTWSAQVRDQETQIVQPVAAFVTPANLNWTEWSTGMIDYIDYPQTDCTSGLSPSRMTYKSAVINNSSVDTNMLQMSNCIKAGAGWSEGIRTVQGALEYKLTMGDSQQ